MKLSIVQRNKRWVVNWTRFTLVFESLGDAMAAAYVITNWQADHDGLPDGTGECCDDCGHSEGSGLPSLGKGSQERLHQTAERLPARPSELLA